MLHQHFFFVRVREILKERRIVRTAPDTTSLSKKKNKTHTHPKTVFPASSGSILLLSTPLLGPTFTDVDYSPMRSRHRDGIILLVHGKPILHSKQTVAAIAA